MKSIPRSLFIVCIFVFCSFSNVIAQEEIEIVTFDSILESNEGTMGGIKVVGDILEVYEAINTIGEATEYRKLDDLERDNIANVEISGEKILFSVLSDIVGLGGISTATLLVNEVARLTGDALQDSFDRVYIESGSFSKTNYNINSIFEYEGRKYTLNFTVEKGVEVGTTLDTYMGYVIIKNFSTSTPGLMELDDFSELIVRLQIGFGATILPFQQNTLSALINSNSKFEIFTRYKGKKLESDIITLGGNLRQKRWLGSELHSDLIFNYTGNAEYLRAPTYTLSQNSNGIEINIEGNDQEYLIYKSETSVIDTSLVEPLSAVTDNYLDTQIKTDQRYYYQIIGLNDGQRTNPSRIKNAIIEGDLEIQISEGEFNLMRNEIGVISGVIKQKNGNSITEAEVKLSVPEIDWSYETVVTSTDGSFKIQFIAPSIIGNYQLKLSANKNNNYGSDITNLFVSKRPEEGHNIEITNFNLVEDFQFAGNNFSISSFVSNIGEFDEYGCSLKYSFYNRNGLVYTFQSIAFDLTLGESKTISSLIQPGTSLPVDDYLVKGLISCESNLDEDYSNNYKHDYIYILGELFDSASFATSSVTFDSLLDTKTISGNEVQLQSIQGDSANFNVNGIPTGYIKEGATEKSIWVNGDQDFIMKPLTVDAFNGIVEINAGSITNTLLVDNVHSFSRRGNNYNVRINTLNDENIDPTSVKYQFSQDAVNLSGSRSNVPDKLIDNSTYQINHGVSKSASIRDYNSWLTWSDSSNTTYYQRVRTSVKPIHDIGIVDGSINDIKIYEPKNVGGEEFGVPIAGMVYRIKGDIQNLGDYSTTESLVSLSISESEHNYQFQSIDTVAAGSGTFKFDWNTIGLKPGTYALVFNILKSDENSVNNTTYGTYTIIKPPPLDVNILPITPKNVGNAFQIATEVNTEGITVKDADVSALITSPTGDIIKRDLSFSSDDNQYHTSFTPDISGNYDIEIQAERSPYKSNSSKSYASCIVEVEFVGRSSSVNITEGEYTSNYLLLSPVGGLSGGKVNFIVDEGELRFEHIEKGDLFSSENKINFQKRRNSTDVEIGFANLDQERDLLSFNESILANFSFRALAPSESKVILSEIGFLDSKGREIPSTVLNDLISYNISERIRLIDYKKSDLSPSIVGEKDTLLVRSIGDSYITGYSSKIDYDPSLIQINHLQSLSKDNILISNIDGNSIDVGVAIESKSSINNLFEIIYTPIQEGEYNFSIKESKLVSEIDNLSLNHKIQQEGQLGTYGTNGEVDTALVEISPDTSFIALDNSFTVSVNINEAQNVYSLATDIGYDPNQLDFVEIKEGSFLNNKGSDQTSFNFNNDSENGIITIGLTRLGETSGLDANSNEELFHITFKKKTSELTSIKLFDTGILLPDGETRLPTRIINGIVQTPTEISLNILGTNGKNGWRFLGTAHTDENYSDLLSNTWTQGATGASSMSGTPNVYSWDEANQQFAALTDLTQTIPNESGFIAYLYEDDVPSETGVQGGWPKTLTSSGTQKTGNTTFPISYTDGADNSLNGFNLLSNPYATSIDWEASNGWTKTNMSDVLYIWDPNANSGIGAYKQRVAGTGDPINVIAPFQAFFVKAAGSGAALSATEEVQTGGGTLMKTTGQDSTMQLSFDLKNGGFEDKIYLSFRDKAITGLDPTDAVQLDPLSSLKMEMFSLTPQGEALAISSLPKNFGNEMTIPLAIETTQEGEYQLSWEKKQIPLGWTILLEDLETGEEIDLNIDSQYFFEMAPNATRQKAKALSKTKLSNEERDLEPRFNLKLLQGNSTLQNDPFANIPATFNLEQNYPNPFNPTTVIRFGLPKASQVSLKVYNILGREVKNLVNRRLNAGYYNVNFNATGLSSGLYFYRITTGSFVKTKKMLIVK